ncbi:MAG: beta-ketoacyl synthase, partial [Deltaproteobacteria bacterium]
FEAYLANGRGPFLRTGDLGFLDQGELYVTGRLKDLMIIRGRNLYPHDIEQTVTQSDPKTFRPDSGAVFSIDVADEERLVVVQEVTRPQRIDPEAVIETIRRTVAERHGVQVHAVALIRPGTLLRTSSGKIRRQPTKAAYLAGELDLVAHWSLDASKEEEAAHEAVASPQTPTPATPSGEGAVRIEAWLVREISRRMNVPPERIDIEEPFIRFGLDSAEAMALIADLEAWIGKPLSPTLVWDYPTIRALSRHLAGEETARPALRATVAAGERNEPLAIVGIGCRFPGAPDVGAFWRLLTEGGDAICEVPPDRFDVERFYHEDPSVPGKMNTRWGGFVEGIDRFDPHFFGISPREAARMDPQQRLLLEVAWEALEDAGIDPHTLAGTLTGVFIGISSNDYAHLQFADPTRIDPYAGTGNAHSIAANRLSYFLGVQGPSLAVDTACSSSLVALHLACQSIRQGECEVAIAGGVNVILNPAITINFAKAGAMAADGRCKAFDRRADGYVRGEGAGIVVLKPLSRALAEGDPIHALVLGSAVNQDGRSNGLMAPNRQAQVEVLRTA